MSMPMSSGWCRATRSSLVWMRRISSRRGRAIDGGDAGCGAAMTLRLVASGNERALAIRDHVLPLLRREGILEVQRDTVRLVEHRMEPWVFRYWTPFSALVPGEASSPGYRHAIERQHTRPDL